MKKRLATLIITFTALFAPLFIPAAAHGVDVVKPVCDGGSIDNSQFCKDDLTNATNNPIYGPGGVLTTAIYIVSLVTAIVATIIIIIAGIKMSLSQGNSQAITTARNQIIYAAIGLVVAGLAQGLVTFVLKRL